MEKTTYLNATSLGARLGLGPAPTNKLLADLGYLAKGQDGKWHPTPKGMQYAKSVFCKDQTGKEYEMLTWDEAVLPALVSAKGPTREEHDLLVTLVGSLRAELAAIHARLDTLA